MDPNANLTPNSAPVQPEPMQPAQTVAPVVDPTPVQPEQMAQPVSTPVTVAEPVVAQTTAPLNPPLNNVAVPEPSMQPQPVSQTEQVAPAMPSSDLGGTTTPPTV